YNVPRSSSSLESSSDTNSETTATTTPSAYAGGFVQHLINRGVYPHGYHYPNGSRIPKPNNFDDIIQRLGRSRRSLSPSKFSNRDFENLQDADTHPCKSVLVDDSTRILEGDDVSGGYRFVNLAPLTDHRLRAIKPSHFFGSRCEELHRRVLQELSHQIDPSDYDCRPVIPNFFLEARGNDVPVSMATRKAWYAGALVLEACTLYSRMDKEGLSTTTMLTLLRPRTLAAISDYTPLMSLIRKFELAGLIELIGLNILRRSLGVGL
ncbi:hypothetical protein EIK77_001839, partial [Talaromyces pinophilus]